VKSEKLKVKSVGRNRSVRKGDTVVVIAGKDKGKRGKVILVDAEGGKVMVEGVNMVIKHKKARSTKQKSKREKITAAMDISNVQILCKCGSVTRVGHKIDDKGNKSRVCTKCGEVLDKKFVKVKEKAKEGEEVADKKEDDKVDKKPLQRREVKHVAESKIKAPQNAAKDVTGHRRIGGA